MSNINKKKGMGIVISTVLSVAIFGAGIALDIKSGASGNGNVFLSGYAKDTGTESADKSETLADNESAAAAMSSQESESHEDEASGENESSSVADVAVASATQEAEEQGPARMEYFKDKVASGMSYYINYIDFTIIRGDSIIAPHATKMENGEQYLKYPNLLEGAEIERRESSGCDEYLFTIDGKSYIFSQYTDGFQEVASEGINPCLSDGIDVTYIVPTSADGTVGDMYYQDVIKTEDVRLVASDVVADSNGVIVMEFVNPYGHYFYYQKYKDGKYSLNQAWIDGLSDHSKADPQWEKVLFEGRKMPLYASDSTLYYYDQDTKELCFVDYYHNEDGDVRTIYTGDYDEYFGFDSSCFMFTVGDDVYFFNQYVTQEAVKILTTGLEDIIFRGEVTDYGFNHGHKIQGDAEYCILKDKSGDEYGIICKHSSSTAKACKLKHKLEEDKVEYFGGPSITYIEDGVLYISTIDDETYENEFAEFIKFDKEKVVDYCADYTGEFFFVYTEEGNLYYQNLEKEETILIDSGLDPDRDGTGCNFAWDIRNEQVVYGKEGKMYSYKPEYDKLEEEDMTYFYLEYEDSLVYCYYKNKDDKFFFENRRAYKIF